MLVMRVDVKRLAETQRCRYCERCIVEGDDVIIFAIGGEYCLTHTDCLRLHKSAQMEGRENG
jgi:hypothetical protein